MVSMPKNVKPHFGRSRCVVSHRAMVVTTSTPKLAPPSPTKPTMTRHHQNNNMPHYLFVAKINIATKPKGTCCFGLEVLPKKSNAQFGVVLNVTKANTFFVACKVSSPSPQQESNAPTSGLNGPMNEISLAPTPA
ncbi:hypothetical protein JHK85_056931 [Glycine max]|nr:hypothetical protein JHK85_056931 [Glycine max]